MLYKRLFYFGLVGVTAACVNMGVVWLLVEKFFHLTPLFANVFAFLTAFWVSYFGHSLFTFNDNTHQLRDAAPRFFIVAIISFLLSEGMYLLLLHLTPLPYLPALALVLIVVALFTFLMGQAWAFKERKQTP